METMSIALPPALKTFVQDQVVEGGYSSASEYIRRLIREDQEQKVREEVDRKLLEALDGSPAAAWSAEDLDKLKRRVKERNPKGQK